MNEPTYMEIARMVALETTPTDSVGLTARRLAWGLIVEHEELLALRAAALTREEAEALRGCSVHCQDEVQLVLATGAIDKAVSRVFKCIRCWDAGVLKVFTSGGEAFAAQFCSCLAGEARRT